MNERDVETVEAVRCILEREAQYRRGKLGPGPDVMLLELGEAVLARVREWAEGGKGERPEQP
jgi:hypothetical protein